jgi:hypothetical protein
MCLLFPNYLLLYYASCCVLQEEKAAAEEAARKAEEEEVRQYRRTLRFKVCTHEGEKVNFG